jgi:hypothetical protein
MSFKFFLFLNIFYFLSPIISIYLPISTSSISLDSDICRIRENGFNYVKGCENGYFCKEIYVLSESVGLCVEGIDMNIKKVGSFCYRNDDCNTGLECQNLKCQLSSYNVYQITDVYGGNYYFCNEGYLYDTVNEMCVRTSYCYNSQGTVTYKPGFFSVCGIQVITSSFYGNYGHSRTEVAEIGTVSDGEFVQDELACSSGFTLEFYVNKQTYYQYDNIKYKMCVTFIDIYDNGYIRYKIGDGEEQIYNATSIVDYTLKTKLFLFKKYKEALNNEKENIKNELNYEEPMTYGKDEVRKWFYLYKNPSIYIMYKNEQQILDYLIQQVYPNYIVKSYEKSSFIDFKYYFILLFIFMI